MRMVSRRAGQVAVIAILAVATSFAFAQSPIPIADVQRSASVTFDQDVLPLFQKKCLACHSASAKKGALVLETPASILKGGETGPAVVAGKSGESLLLKLASH